MAACPFFALGAALFGAPQAQAAEAAFPSRPIRFLVGFTPGPLTITPNLEARMSFDPDKDFQPITQVASTMAVLLAHPSMPGTVAGTGTHTCTSRGDPAPRDRRVCRVAGRA